MVLTRNLRNRLLGPVRTASGKSRTTTHKITLALRRRKGMTVLQSQQRLKTNILALGILSRSEIRIKVWVRVRVRRLKIFNVQIESSSNNIQGKTKTLLVLKHKLQVHNLQLLANKRKLSVKQHLVNKISASALLISGNHLSSNSSSLNGRKFSVLLRRVCQFNPTIKDLFNQL